MAREIHEILRDIAERQCRGSSKFYRRLEDPEERKLLLDWYEKHLVYPSKGILFNNAGTKIAMRYNRIVIGDYGPYVEISPEDIVLDNISPKWPGEPKRPVKYIWMETKDELKTKIYYQKGRVTYADYIPGLYYVSPDDIRKDKPIGDGTCFESR